MDNSAPIETEQSKRQAKQKEAIIEHLQKLPIVSAVCEKIGIGRATFYRWKSEDKIFQKNIDDALLNGCCLVNDLAEANILNQIKDQNLTAAIFWLKNHHKTYRDRIEVSAKRDEDDELTPEEEKAVEEALKLAKLACNPTQDGSEKDSQ